MQLSALCIGIPGARRVPPEQIHLTLAFPGDVEEAVTECLCDELSRIRISRFDLRCAGVGCFPGRQRPRVLWAGVEPEQRLLALAAAVQSALAACGIPLEERHFSPHITLARLKQPQPHGADRFLAGPPGVFPPFSVGEFILFQSILSSSGAQHIPLRRFPLV